MAQPDGTTRPRLNIAKSAYARLERDPSASSRGLFGPSSHPDWEQFAPRSGGSLSSVARCWKVFIRDLPQYLDRHVRVRTRVLTSVGEATARTHRRNPHVGRDILFGSIRSSPLSENISATCRYIINQLSILTLSPFFLAKAALMGQAFLRTSDRICPNETPAGMPPAKYSCP